MTDNTFERFFKLSLDMLCIAGTDGYFKRVNPSFERALGWPSEDLISQPFIDFVHPDDKAATLKELDRLKSGLPTHSFQNRYRCSDGTYRHLQWTAYPELESGLLFAVARDTGELMEANHRFQVAIDASPVAFLMIDDGGVIHLVNSETERLFGYSRDFLIGKVIELLVPPKVHTEHQKERINFFQDPRTRAMGSGRYVEAVRRDGEVFPVEIGLNHVRFRDGDFVLCTVLDLTFQKTEEEKRIQIAKELEEANTRLQKLAVTDQLTDVLNRRALDEQLEKHIKLMSRMGRFISLLMLDIDHFKRYNDMYGHPAGDTVLETLARLLRENARTTDVIARYGGEEFAIVLPDTNEIGALRMAERFRLKIHDHPWETGNLTISVGASTMGFGMPATRNLSDTGDKLISEADQALYYSKNNGRDRVTHASQLKDTDQLRDS